MSIFAKIASGPIFLLLTVKYIIIAKNLALCTGT